MGDEWARETFNLRHTGRTVPNWLYCDVGGMYAHNRLHNQAVFPRRSEHIRKAAKSGDTRQHHPDSRQFLAGWGASCVAKSRHFKTASPTSQIDLEHTQGALAPGTRPEAPWQDRRGCGVFRAGQRRRRGGRQTVMTAASSSSDKRCRDTTLPRRVKSG